MDTTASKTGISADLIHEIARRILTVAKPDKIIMFGSAAENRMTPDSDIDLLIVEPQPESGNDEYVRVVRALRGLGYPFDILFISTEWYEESKDVVGGIAYPASRQGKVIYDAA